MKISINVLFSIFACIHYILYILVFQYIPQTVLKSHIGCNLLCKQIQLNVFVPKQLMCLLYLTIFHLQISDQNAQNANSSE